MCENSLIERSGGMDRWSWSDAPHKNPLVIQQTDTQNTTSKMQNEPAAVLFSHNHLHDLESLWWVAVWMVFYHHLSKLKQSDKCLSTNI